MFTQMIYICAGMPRSGSTWLYNAVRLILTRAGVPGLAAGWIGDKAHLLSQENPVIKIHAYDPKLASLKAVVLTSHRDLRDVAASLCRKFKTPSPLDNLREAVEHHAHWSRLAAYDLHYENLLADKMRELRNVADALSLPPAAIAALPYDAILKEIDGEKFSKDRSTAERFDKVNLLHDGHITDGRHGSWTKTLPAELVTGIEKEFRTWLATRGYAA